MHIIYTCSGSKARKLSVLTLYERGKLVARDRTSCSAGHTVRGVYDSLNRERSRFCHAIQLERRQLPSTRQLATHSFATQHSQAGAQNTIQL